MIGAEFWVSAVVVMLIVVASGTLPMLRKRNLYFGVTVDPAFRESPGGRAIALEYRLILLGFGAAAVAWVALSSADPVRAPLLAVAGGFVAWVRAWSRTRPSAVAVQTVRSAPLLEDSTEGLPGGWASVAVPLGAQLVSFGIVLSRYDDLPRQLPIHWGLSGEADRWVEKSWAAVSAASLAGLLVTSILFGGAWMILRTAKRGSGGETGDFGTKHRRGNVTMLVATVWALTFVFCVASQLPLHPEWGNHGLKLVFLLPVVIVLIKAVQLYVLSAKATGGSDGTPEDCWKFGAFYYNPADPALMVEKRSGPGFTLNFGHRLSWVLLAVFAGVMLIPALARR